MKYEYIRLLNYFSVMVFVFFVISQGHLLCKERTLSGVVIDSVTKKPIPYVNISIIGTSLGSMTNEEGQFTLYLNDERNEIVFSHVNYHKNSSQIVDLLSTKFVEITMAPKDSHLEEIVVSASLYKQPIIMLSKPAVVISNRLISDEMQSNIIDALVSTPGFTQIWEYHSPLLLRGMNSNRLVVMDNGSRRIGTFPGGYFAQDLNIYDAQRIEIVKGPGSVIYGSGAISGIINIINNEPFGKERTSGRITSGFGSNNNEWLEVGRLCYKKENYGFELGAKFRQSNDMVYGDGTVAENSNVKDIDFSLNSGYRFSEDQSVILRMKYHNGDWGKPRGFNGPSNAFTRIRNNEEGLHTALKYSYKPRKVLDEAVLNLFIDNGKRDYYKYKHSTVSGKVTALDLVHYKNLYGGGQFYSVLNLTSNNKLTSGIDGYFFRLDNPAEIIDYYNDTKGELEGFMGAGQQNIGAFVNNDWQLTNSLRMISGIRFDIAKVNEGQHSKKDEREEARSALSGNLGLVYSIQENMNISFNLGRAFRMPNAEELFTEVISCKGIKLGNPDLKPEFSWNVDIGFRGNSLNGNLRYDLAFFYNRFFDFISDVPADDMPDVDFTFKNTDAVLMGGEFSALYHFERVLRPSNSLIIGVGAAYVYGIDLLAGDDAALFGIPPLKIQTNITYRGLLNSNWITGYFMKIESEYASMQKRIPVAPDGSVGGPWGYIPSESHITFNLALGLNSNSLPLYPKLRFVIRNLLDQDYKPYGSYIPAMGRNIKTVLSLNI
jgi:outer membrane receptor protein involved in Fe transport